MKMKQKMSKKIEGEDFKIKELYEESKESGESELSEESDLCEDYLNVLKPMETVKKQKSMEFLIPCEICGELIMFGKYVNHTK